MFNVNDYDILRNHQCSLQETSKDTSKAKVQYMTTCTKKVVDFDAVKTEFLNSLNETEECAKSVDAFVIDDYNYFIEFKNGDARKEKNDIINKAKDSMLIMNCILNRQINKSRLNDIFILVYNEKEVTINPKELRAGALAKKANKQFTLFGLGQMKGFCYKDVKTLTKDMFEEEVVKALGW